MALGSIFIRFATESLELAEGRELLMCCLVCMGLLAERMREDCEERF